MPTLAERRQQQANAASSQGSGDFIKFKGVGAYTICLTPTFINFLAPILTVENGEYKEVRRRQNVDDILTIYKA